MTKSGYADVEKSDSAKKNIQQGAKALYAQRARTSPKFTSEVKISSITADTAKTSIGFQLRTQQKSGGDWKTLKTATKDTAKMELVKQGDKWLVDKL